MSKYSKVSKICIECNSEFKVQKYREFSAKFCSKKCKKENQKDKLIEIQCKNCDKKFNRKEGKITKNNFCSKNCSDKYNVGKNHYEYKEHLHDKNYKTALKQWSNIIKERDNFICKLCGENDKNVLEAHHLKEKSNFPELQFSFDNGICLCLKCHKLQHLNDPKSLRLIEYKIIKYYENKE